MRVLQVIKINDYQKELLFKDTATTVENTDTTVIYKNKVYNSQAVKQLLEARLSVLKGELLYNPSLGITLKQDKDATNLNILEIITSTPGVKSAIVKDSKLVDGKFKSNFIIQTIFDENITIYI